MLHTSFSCSLRSYLHICMYVCNLRASKAPQVRIYSNNSLTVLFFIRNTVFVVVEFMCVKNNAFHQKKRKKKQKAKLKMEIIISHFAVKKAEYFMNTHTSIHTYMHENIENTTVACLPLPSTLIHTKICYQNHHYYCYICTYKPTHKGYCH